MVNGGLILLCAYLISFVMLNGIERIYMVVNFVI